MQALRLVNKQLAAAAAPYLFDTVPVWFSVRSLQRLTWLSEHPQLCHYVRAIAISPLRFIDDSDVDAHETSIRDWFEYRHGSISSHELSVARYIAAYKRYIAAQRSLQKKSLDVKILIRAFSKFSRLEEIHVNFWDRYTGTRELTEASGTFQCEGLLMKDCEYVLPAIIRALAGSNAYIRVFKLGVEDDWTDDYDNEDRLGLGNAVYATHTLPSTQRPVSPYPFRPYESSYTEKMSSQALSDTFGHDDLVGVRDKYGCRHARRGVKTLEIGETHPIYKDSRSLPQMMDGMRGLMKHASQLESVTIGEIDLNRSANYATLKGIIGRSYLKHLRPVDLLHL